MTKNAGYSTEEAQWEIIPNHSRQLSEDISMEFHKWLNGTGNAITGCSILPGGAMPFTNNDECVRFKQWRIKRLKKTQKRYLAFDFKCIYNDEVLATKSCNYGTQCIAFMDMKDKQV